MNLEVAFAGEALAALRAGEANSAVGNLLVLLKQILVGEDLLALATFERF